MHFFVSGGKKICPRCCDDDSAPKKRLSIFVFFNPVSQNNNSNNRRAYFHTTSRIFKPGTRRKKEKISLLRKGRKKRKPWLHINGVISIFCLLFSSSSPGQAVNLERTKGKGEIWQF